MAAQRIRIKKGLDLPLAGAPEQTIEAGPAVSRVAIVGGDYVGMRPTMAVAEGDRVEPGQVLFEDKKTPGVLFAAPGAGTVAAVNRGPKRVLDSVVLELSDPDVTAAPVAGISSGSEDAAKVRQHLQQTGLWTAFRTRPFSRVPAPDATPHSVFVTAMDSGPLAADPAVVLAGQEDDWQAGVEAMTGLTAGNVYVCTAPQSGVPVPGAERIEHAEFAGPHPAGLPGTHIHFLDPVGPTKTVWHIDYQDVAAVGKLLRTGQLETARVVALGGPAMTRPRLLRTRLGASLDELLRDEVETGDVRVISGSVLNGRAVAGTTAFLGRYHRQLTALFEGLEREFLGWQTPGFDKFSVKRIFASRLRPGHRFAMTTSTGGSTRAMVPIGSYEQVMPLDVLPTYLLRALIVGDTEKAQSLGCLELDEEDLALCTFVCPGKYDYAPILRRNLDTIEKEG